MYALNTTSQSLTASVSTNVSTAQPTVICVYRDLLWVTKSDYSAYRSVIQATTMSGTTTVTILSPPPVQTTRELLKAGIFNGETSTYLAIKVNWKDGGTTYPLVQRNISSMQTLETGEGRWHTT